MKNNGDDILVSVCMLTYNHERYIEEAILGVLSQVVNFKIEFIIGEDFSTDKTRDICKKYRDKYPNLIKLVLSETNKGANFNAKRVLNLCKGKYIAFCEGDDYWTDPYKLQKQVDFMINNSEYSIIYHRVMLRNESSGILEHENNNISDEEKEYDIVDLATKKNFIHTPSVLIRRDSIDIEFINKNDVNLMDYCLWIICSEKGKIKYLPDIMSVYRIWNGSTWELKNDYHKSLTWVYTLIPLVKKMYNNKNIYFLLLEQLKTNYRIVYNSKDIIDNKIDLITKKLLNEVPDIQYWWFNYQIYKKSSRIYRFKYFLYLLIKRSLSSFLLIKKCIY